MIIDHFPNFIQRVMKNSEDNFYHVIQGCRQCKYTGNLHRHASYYRNVICEEVTARVKIQRVICTNCGKTHAIIPSDLIPYFQHSLKTIIRLLEIIKIKKNSYSSALKFLKEFNIACSYGQICFYNKRFEVNMYRICYYFRVYCNLFPPPAASEASVVNLILNFELKEFNLSYFDKMPNYFLAKVTN